MKEEPLGGWPDLGRLVEEHKRENWIYRGVTQHDHRLIPTIGRKGARQDEGGGDLPHDASQERLLLDEFMRQARPMIESQPETELEWMAIAQHHGLRTRLLDWTESLLVAAMFATESGVTYAINRETGETFVLPPAIYGIRGLPEAQPHDNPFDLDDVKIYRPAHISPRIAPQQSVFTVHPNPHEAFDHDHLVQWSMEIGGTIEVKLALDAVGISRASLFPGIDGLAGALNWRHKWGRLRGIAPVY